ncbi:hypothetical protein J3E73DRAFT_435483 [Bipolaris maydis]|nr:hypothetical protein J3E73DRAFT_435483 [Bipolaris maydis]
MRTGLLSASLAMAVGVSALPSPQVMAGSLPELAAKLSGEASTLLTDLINGVAKALPAEAFKTQYSHTPVPIEEARAALEHYTFNMSEVIGSGKYDKRQSAQRCANPTIYIEWDRSNDDQRQKYFDAFKCLMSRPPSGQFAASKSRYEDLTALHQTLTPNVHDNGKFLPWHRAFIQLLRRLMHDECGSKWLGSLGINGRCVTDGQFANLICNVGPGTSDQPHCLSRNGDGSVTKNCNQEYVDICNQYPDWAGMTRCSFSGVHGFGHNGIGRNPQWLSQTNGVDAFGNALTLDTKVNTMGMMPDLTIRDPPRYSKLLHPVYTFYSSSMPPFLACKMIQIAPNAP